MSQHLSKCHIVGNHMSRLICCVLPGKDLSPVKSFKPPPPPPPPCGFSCSLFYKGGCSVVIDSLFIVAPIACGVSVFGPCFVMQYIHPF